MTPTPLTIETVEMHTGGEPVRIVVAGYPPIPGATLLAKRRQARERLDHLRHLLMFEPRGHFDMSCSPHCQARRDGAIPLEPDLPGADLAVLFMRERGLRHHVPGCCRAVRFVAQFNNCSTNE